jgi:hypothetical protein
LGQHEISGKSIMLGNGSVDVAASQGDHRLRTDVRMSHLDTGLAIGAVLPAGARVSSVSLNGHAVGFDVVQTMRGDEVRVWAGVHSATLEVSYR